VLGGTFDPPHLAHLVLGAAARRALRLDRVLFVPAGEPWRKAEREVTPAALRLELVRAAVQPLAWAEVSTLEVERPGPSYLVDTLRELERGGGEWWFLLGVDALADLPQWHEPAAILELARLGVAARPGAAVDIATADAALPGLAARCDVVSMPALAISATALRARIAAGGSTRYLVPEAVRALIDQHELYRGDGAAKGQKP
jgi:nicotinate-nucleotide adenylyltransferase